MDNDNLYPRSGQYLMREPSEQVLEREKEAAQVTAGLPILRQVIERLDERIAFYTSVDSVPKDLDIKPEEFMHTVAANRLTRDNLIAEKDTLEELIRAHVN